MTTSISESFVSIVGSYEVDSNDITAFANIATESIKATLTKRGCLYYIASQDLLKSNVFHLAEGWASQTDLNDHLASASFKEMMEQALKLRILNREIYVSQSHGRTLLV
jgi:quinol monooxygenase YgiN